MSPRASMKAAAQPHFLQGYDPRQDRGDYMNSRMRAYFYRLLKTRLEETRDDIEKHNRAFANVVQSADIIDQANNIGEEIVAKKLLANLSKVRNKIQSALVIFDQDPHSYGFDQHGEEIGVERLMLVPWATTSADDKNKAKRILPTRDSMPRRPG